MIDAPALSLTLAGAVLALLIGVAVIALYTGLRARGGNAELVRRLARVEAMLATAPALAMIVRSDGRLELPDRLADWFGLSLPPRYLSDLSEDGAGMSAEDLANLAAEVQATQRSGRRFELAVQMQGSMRRLAIRGQGASAEMQAPGGVILWVFDATESAQAIVDLTHEVGRYRDAYEALLGLIEAAPMPMWYRGPDLRLMMVNSAYVDAVDARDADDVVARGLELFEGSGVGGPLAGAAAAREGGMPQVQPMPATIKGARRMLRVFDVPLATGGVAGFAIDVEELEQARAGIKRFADAQRALLDRLSAGVVQFGPDRAMTFCNQPFRRMFAMRSEWLADRPEFDRVLERMREANRLPEVRDFPGWKRERGDWFVAADDGQIEENWHLPGGVHLRLIAQPLPDGGLLLIFEDRTEQIQLASARDTLLRVRTATFDNLFEALGVFASDGRLQIWNNRFRSIFAFEEEFLGAHPRVDALAQAAAPRLANAGRAKLIGELVRSATVERQQRGGELIFADGRHFELAAVPLPDGNALVTMLDISDRRKIERALRDRNEALEAADRVKTAFVANMSYELRTPLTSISGFAEMLQGGYAGELPPVAVEYVTAILDSVERLGGLVDDVLDLTRDGDADPALELETVDLAALVRSLADKLGPQMTAGKLEFAVEIKASAGEVQGDPRRLAQIVENMLRHAIVGTSAGGRILLLADGSKDAVRVLVSDNGRGMTEKAIARAFDRFAEPGITRGGERALGLGLPLARQFAEAHGGTIKLVSERGQGTIIKLELPRQQPALAKS